MLLFDIMPNMTTERERTEAYYEYVKGLMERCYDAVNETPGLRGSNGKITFAEFVDVVGRGLVELGVFTPEEVCLKTTETKKELLPTNTVYQFLDCEYNPDTGIVTRPNGRFTLKNRLSVPFSAIISRQGSIVTHSDIRCAFENAGYSASDPSIKTSIHSLRNRLGELGLSGLFVTVVKKGYRFTAEVRAIQKS